MNSNLNQNKENFQNDTENDIEEVDLNEMEVQNQNQLRNNNLEDSPRNENSDNNKNTDPNEEPIYVMTLALEQGKSEKIEIFSNSDPSELAYNFCRRNNLDFNALDYLREQITSLLETYAKNENDDEEEENNINDEVNKEEDENINIPEIEEAQEDQEINSTENIKENNNNEDKFIINSNDNNIEINEISPEELLNDDENNEKNMDHVDAPNPYFNNHINNNDEEEDKEDHNSDEIVEEIDFQNIHKSQNNDDKNLEIKHNDIDDKINKKKELFNDIPNFEVKEQNKSNEYIKKEDNLDNNLENNNEHLENELFMVEDNNNVNEINNGENDEQEINVIYKKNHDNEDNIINDKNKSKKKYKINEDIIIGVGDFNKQSNDDLDINGLEINDIERMKREILEKETIKDENNNENSDKNNDIYNKEDNNINENLENIHKNEDYFGNKNNKFEDNKIENNIRVDDTNNIIENENLEKNPTEIEKNENILEKEKDNISEQIRTNNYIQETKTNTNIVLNDEEENINNETYPKNEEIIIAQNNENKKESLMSKTDKILNKSKKFESKDDNNNLIRNEYESNSSSINQKNKSKPNKNINSNLLFDNLSKKEKNSNSFSKKENANNFINNNLPINKKEQKVIKNNNIIMANNKINGEDKKPQNYLNNYSYNENNLYNKDVDINKNNKEKRNTFSFQSSDNKYNKNVAKIQNNNEIQRHSDIVGQNAKNYIKYLSERNKLLKEEKDKEILSIQKELDKFDSKKNLNNKNINPNNIYDIENYNNNNYLQCNNQFLGNKINAQTHNTNYYNKNISLRKLNKLKEEYDQKYSFQPVINDNYKTDLTFNERLSIFNNISKQKKEELKNNLSNLKADENGQEFFKPKLISKQYFSNNIKKNKNKINEIENNDKIDVFNKNYLYYKKYNSNKEKLYNKYYYSYTNEPHIYSKIESDKLINEANTKAFSNLFNELDSDQDNLITSLTINLNNIPDNVLKIIEPLLIELKEDNQTLNQDEFIKAMTKLFENISSTDRRQIINEYNKRRQNNINGNNKKSLINSYNKNIKKPRKNYSFSKKERDSDTSHLTNISNNKVFTRNYISTDNNNFDNNFLSCRPKTPGYGMLHKNKRNNYFNSNINNNKELKTITNHNTNKLAHKHFIRVQKMMNDYNNKYKTNSNNNKININNCFDNGYKINKNNNKIENNKTNKESYRNIILNGNKKFSCINDCTFNNYLKNLN